MEEGKVCMHVYDQALAELPTLRPHASLGQRPHTCDTDSQGCGHMQWPCPADQSSCLGTWFSLQVKCSITTILRCHVKLSTEQWLLTALLRWEQWTHPQRCSTCNVNTEECPNWQLACPIWLLVGVVTMERNPAAAWESELLKRKGNFPLLMASLIPTPPDGCQRSEETRYTQEETPLHTDDEHK